MKKFLASVLAVACVAGLTATAFADDNQAESIHVDNDSKIYTEVDDAIVEFTGSKLTVAPGDTIYIEIQPEVDGQDITSKVAGRFKVVTEMTVGSKDLIDSATIEQKKVTEYVDAGIGASGTTEQVYRYLAAIKTEESFSTEVEDLVADVKVVKKTSGNSADAPIYNLGAEIGHGSVTVTGDYVDVTTENPVVRFEDVDTVELAFGDTATFVVNAKNQDDLFMGYNTKPNTAVIDANPDANIDFLTFEAAPVFNRIGKLYIYADKDAKIYELTSKGVEKIKAEYDEDYEAFVIETRTLGSYVISDAEIDYIPSEDDNNSSSSDNNSSNSGSNNGGSSNGGSTTKPSTNPDTGANDIANVAMVAAVVSLTAIGALAVKKSSKK